MYKKLHGNISNKDVKELLKAYNIQSVNNYSANVKKLADYVTTHNIDIVEQSPRKFITGGPGTEGMSIGTHEDRIRTKRFLTEVPVLVPAKQGAATHAKQERAAEPTLAAKLKSALDEKPTRRIYRRKMK